MVGDRFGGQEHAQDVPDLSQAQPHGEGGRRQFLQLVLVEEDAGAGRRLRRGDRLGPRSLLGRGISRRLDDESLFELVGVPVDGLAAVAGLLGLAGDGTIPTGEDGSGVEDPGADRSLEYRESLRDGEVPARLSFHHGGAPPSTDLSTRSKADTAGERQSLN
jgi:hypothetical protein